MSISQLFILSLRGDTIIYRDFRKDINKGINEVFFRKVNFFEAEEQAPPVFNVDGINFIYVKKSDLYIVLVTLENVSSSYFFEILESFMKLIRDYCGVLSEEAIRKNFVLIYEIIDEMIDFGFPQLKSTDHIQPFVVTAPVVIVKQENKLKSMIDHSTTGGTSSQKPLSNNKSKKNEIFVDIIEKLTVLYNSSGSLINFGIEGCIKMKSYLKGNPELRMVLNDDLLIGRSGYGTSIEDCNFHPKVNSDDFQSKKTLVISPPLGEFIAMNYRINSEFPAPFKIYSLVEESDYKLELKMKVQSNFSDKFFGGNVVLKFNVPKSSQSVHFDLPKNKLGQKVDYITGDKICVWGIAKFQGGAEHNLVTKITLQNNNPKECKKELGPVTMSFEISTYTVSKLQVKELKIMTMDKNYNPLRWIRSLTQANSYVLRIA